MWSWSAIYFKGSWNLHRLQSYLPRKSQFPGVFNTNQMEWTNSSLMNIIWIKSFVFSSGKDIFKGHRNPQYYHDESCRNSNRSLEMPLQKLETLGLHIRNQPLFLSFYLMFIILSSNSWMSDLIFKQNSPFMYLPHKSFMFSLCHFPPNRISDSSQHWY